MSAILSNENARRAPRINILGFETSAKPAWTLAAALALAVPVAHALLMPAESSVAGLQAADFPAADHAAEGGAAEALDASPIPFEVNRGQWGPSIRYAARGLRYSIAFGVQELLIRANERGVTAALRFRGANPAPVQEVIGIAPTPANRASGSDRSRWLSDAQTRAKVAYHNVYPGIDAIFYGDRQELAYDFVVARGADPAQIAFEFNGADSVRITETGDLAIVIGGETLTQKAPLIYQDIAGERRYVQGRYVARPRRAISLEIDQYDRKYALYIDSLAS